MKRFLLQTAVLLVGTYAFLLVGSLIEALTPCPLGTILVLLVCMFGGWKLLELEEKEQKKAARRGAASPPRRGGRK